MVAAYKQRRDFLLIEHRPEGQVVEGRWNKGKLEGTVVIKEQNLDQPADEHTDGNLIKLEGMTPTTNPH